MAQKSGRVDPAVEQVAEAVVDRLGFELVELEKAGHRARPILRLRIDRPSSEPGHGVTVDDCALVSRQLESELDDRGDLPSSYILEVSSPGVERPLRKRSDFERCVGREVMIRGFEPLTGGSKRVEGVLLAVENSGDSVVIRVRRADETEVEAPLSAIAKAQLLVNWNDFKFGSSRER
jgi:ribosome maturation factor RimP